MSLKLKPRVLFAVMLMFRVMVGFVVLVWSPYSILSAHPGRPVAELMPLTVAGVLLMGAGGIGYLWCVWDFAFTGLSFSPGVVVARGIYGVVRHPMYSSSMAVVLGESLFFKSWRLLGYAAAGAVLLNLLVILYEEPAMVKKWGAGYREYAARVPRWIPRIPKRELHG
jgi:protein-S-isoprenylcysteine O-methyltransferase Ste14